MGPFFFQIKESGMKSGGGGVALPNMGWGFMTIIDKAELGRN